MKLHWNITVSHDVVCVRIRTTSTYNKLKHFVHPVNSEKQCYGICLYRLSWKMLENVFSLEFSRFQWEIWEYGKQKIHLKTDFNMFHIKLYTSHRQRDLVKFYGMILILCFQKLYLQARRKYLNIGIQSKIDNVLNSNILIKCEKVIPHRRLSR